MWNAQSLFMRFFPLVLPDEKPKGISLCWFVIFHRNSCKSLDSFSRYYRCMKYLMHVIQCSLVDFCDLA